MIAIKGPDLRQAVRTFCAELKHNVFYVYRWRRGDEWLYVGSTRNVFNRMLTHRVIGKVEPLQDNDVIEFVECTDKLTMLLTEHAFQVEQQPKYNKIGCVDRKKLSREEREERANKIRAQYGLGPLHEAAKINHSI